MPAAADRANQELVDRLIAEGTLWSPELIAAFRATPRHRFLDRVFQYQRKANRWREIITRDPGPEELRLVYSDRALITHIGPSRERPGRPLSSSSQPSLMAQMLEDLHPARDLRILEVGSGTGYNAALLAHVAGPERVVSVDVDRNVLSEAWDHLQSFPERQVELQQADGRQGCPERAPFDRIMVTAATPDLEPAWLEQLAAGGLVLAPLTLAPGLAYVVSGGVHEGCFRGRPTRPAYFMPLRAEGEAAETTEEPVPPAAGFRVVPAPWAGWFERRRPRGSWLSFIHGLALYGLLQGLRVHYQTLETGETVYGVSRENSACWLGARAWHLSGPSGRELAWALWRAYLDAGAPRATDYDLEASPERPLPPSPGTAYLRHGSRCRQRWTLRVPRERPWG